MTGQMPENQFRSELLGRRSFFGWLTYGLSGVALAAAGIPLVGYFVGVRKRKEIPWVNLGAVRSVSDQRNSAKGLRQSPPCALGRRDRPDGSLRPQPGFGQAREFAVLGIRRELCPLGLPGLVVSGVRTVHVPLSWRRLLRQRRPGGRASAPRPLPLRLAGARRPAGDPGAPLPDLTGPLVKDRK